MTCYFYINVTGRKVNEYSAWKLLFGSHSRRQQIGVLRLLRRRLIDRGMIGIRGFLPYGKHTPRLQASSLCGRKSPRSCLYISGRCPSVNSHLFARAMSDFSASLQLSPKSTRVRKGEKIRLASAVYPSRT